MIEKRQIILVVSDVENDKNTLSKLLCSEGYIVILSNSTDYPAAGGFFHRYGEYIKKTPI